MVIEFLEEPNIRKKALLILDYAPNHLPANQLVKAIDDRLIWAMLKLLNVTPLFQQIDQSRNRLLSKIIVTMKQIISQDL